MSGICGFTGSTSSSTDERCLSSMLERMEHRGPARHALRALGDGTGLAQNQLHAVQAGSRQERGFYSSADLLVALDGRVTNRAEILARLPEEPPPAGAGLDARAVAAAYRSHGERLLEELDGPFALALWDRGANRLLLARDKLGEKSLYYHCDPGQAKLVFATEIKSLTAHAGVSAELDPDSLPLHFAFGYVPGPGTLFRGVHKLLPGECLSLEPGRAPVRRRYYRLPAITDGHLDEESCQHRARELFLTALERSIGGCQDVAVFLSGGIDSTILVAALRELGVPRIHSFTIGFTIDPDRPDNQADLRYAREVAELYGTRHHEVLVEPGHDPCARLERVITQFDNLVMTPNSYSKCLLAEAVKQAGLDSVVTGSAAAGACGIHRQFVDPKARRKWIQKTQHCATDEERYYVLRGKLFSLQEQRDILRRPPRAGMREVVEALHHYMGDVQAPDFFRRFLFSNLLITSMEKSIRVLDTVAAMSSLELRSPFVDRALVEFSTTLPGSFDGGKTFVSLKTVMKAAFEKELPRSTRERYVIGYPSYYWQRGELEPLQRRLFDREGLEGSGILSHAGVARVLEAEQHSDAKSVGKRGWALLQFCLWHEVHIQRHLTH